LTTARRLTAEFVGTFALVFAGCGAIMVAAKTGAIAIGGTVVLDALFGGPVSGASMNPARSIGPAFVSGDVHALWLYVAAPLAGAALGALVYRFLRSQPRTELG
jgi:aquaporin NIP